MVTKEEKVAVRCPCKKVHNKKRSDLLVNDNHCSALLGFFDPYGTGETVVKCRDCKRLVTVAPVNGVLHLTKHEERYKVPVNELGKVVVDVP